MLDKNTVDIRNNKLRVCKHIFCVSRLIKVISCQSSGVFVYILK